MPSFLLAAATAGTAREALNPPRAMMTHIRHNTPLKTHTPAHAADPRAQRRPLYRPEPSALCCARCRMYCVQSMKRPAQFWRHDSSLLER